MNVMAITGFTIACISLFLDLFGLLAIVGIVLSVIEMTQVSNTNERGKGFAIADIILGAVKVLGQAI